MKIQNTSDYDTRDLRRLFIACEKHAGIDYQCRRVKVRRSHSSRIHGRAWFHSGFVQMMLPSPKHGPLMRRRVAQIYIHEADHCLQLHHPEMIDYDQINVTWLDDGPLRERPVRQPKLKRPLVERRAEHAAQKLADWQKKLRRAKTGVAKWQKKVRYYERRAAAAKESEDN